jgi:GDPmannose 4,6-dehydratase
VSRKISRAVAAPEPGQQGTLYIGNFNAKRDWGHARDYVEGMWLILQQTELDDYMLSIGESHSVREFVEKAFVCVGRSIEWRGTGVHEQGVDARPGKVLVEVDPGVSGQPLWNCLLAIRLRPVQNSAGNTRCLWTSWSQKWSKPI